MRAIVADDRIRARKYVFDSENKSVEYVNGTTNRINLAKNPRFTNTSGTVEVRRNLFANPRGVNWGGWGSWAGSGGTSTNMNEVVTDHPLGITTARKTVWNTGTTSPSGGLSFGSSAGNLSLTAGAIYTFSCWVKTSVNQVIGPAVRWRDASGALISTTSGNTVSVPANVWTRISIIGVVAPENTAYADIPMFVSSDGIKWAPGDTMLATGALADASPILRDYMDGSYSPDPDLSPVWVGTANASQSYLRGFVPGNTSANYSFSVASSYGMRSIPNNVASNDSNARVGGSSSALSGYGVAFTPGKWYGFQAVCTLLAPQTGTLNGSARRMRMSYNSVSGWTGASQDFSVQPPNEAGSYREELVTQLPADTVWASLQLYNCASFGNGDVYWDKLLIVEGDTEAEVRSKLAQGYFDGDTIIIR